ncbi:glutamate racemase [Pseudoalteromonas sp. SSDWG2]|uniref:glutamate racemase n=1 Tax=Pseudoalteromonas sp. SSDWG2 TaxID=3139391 RepID=UPI003BA9D1A4
MYVVLLHLPIGIFDSGIGGISVAQAVHQLLPSEDIMYIADTGFMPYGSKSTEQVLKRCDTIVSHFCKQGSKAIVVACNTATMAAISTLRARTDIPIIGVEPGVKPALANSQTGIIGVLATPSTIASSSFQRLCERQLQGHGEIVYQPCPELAPSIEALKLEGEHIESMLRQYTQPLLNQGVDTLVLGCTHYAFVAKALANVVPKHVRIITTEHAVARQVQRRLGECALKPHGQGNIALMTSGSLAPFKAQVRTLWPALHDTQLRRFTY